MWRKLWYDTEGSTIRGSFIQLSITVIYLGLIITGSFVSWVATNLQSLESLLIGFFLVSFGVYTGKKTVEFVKNKNVSSVLNKFGLNVDDLPEAGETLRTKRTNGISLKVGNGQDDAPDEAAQRARERESAK